MAGQEIIPLFRPDFRDAEIEAVAEVMRSGWIGLGPKVEEFEKKFAEYVGARYAVAVNSCTAALHLTLLAYGIGPGDEVLVPAISFVSTAHAVEYVGATPVFVDVEADTLCMDPDDIPRKISEDTKAVIPMHYGGHACDMYRVAEIACEIKRKDKHRKLYIFDDAAHACGATGYDFSAEPGEWDKIGGMCSVNATCFSFHAVKNLATADGGMITTSDKGLAAKLRRLRWCGIDKDTWQRCDEPGYGWHYEVTDLGYKYHMNDLTAAIGLVQLERLDSMNARRREIAGIYSEAFKGIDWLTTPIEKDYAKSSCHNYSLRVTGGVDRNDFISHMLSKGISAGVHYMPIYMHPYYQKYSADCPVADEVWQRIVLLPLFPSMTPKQINRVISALKEYRC